MRKYVYKGTVYYPKRFDYNNYRVDYELFEQDGMWNAIIESYQDAISPILFQCSGKKECDNSLKTWFRKMVDQDLVEQLMQKEYKIYPVFEDVLYSVREKPLGYHISKTVNRESILTKGLLPNGAPDLDVMQASRIIDSVRPAWVPDWVVRQNVVYAHPSISNFIITEKYYTDCDLYAVRLLPERCWVGSIGLGGFCLFDKDMKPEEVKEHIKKIKKHEGKLYWKYSCSLEEYISNTKEVQKKDKAYGLDEILITYPVSALDIYLIGHWDGEGIFHETERFRDFVKEKYRNNYLDILQKYSV